MWCDNVYDIMFTCPHFTKHVMHYIILYCIVWYRVLLFSIIFFCFCFCFCFVVAVYFYRNTNRVQFNKVLFIDNHAGDGGGMLCMYIHIYIPYIYYVAPCILLYITLLLCMLLLNSIYIYIYIIWFIYIWFVILYCIEYCCVGSSCYSNLFFNIITWYLFFVSFYNFRILWILRQHCHWFLQY